MILLHFLIIAGNLYFLLLSLSNVLWLRLSSVRPRTTWKGKVSVLIPARNEESNIGRCLDSLLQQSYPDYEIVVLDDLSKDRTWQIITGYAERYPGRIRALKGSALPKQGWCGKTHAMQTLSRYAQGEYLLFTDADTVHSPQSIAWAVTNINRHKADMLSGYAYLELGSFGESLIVPATYIMSTIVMPLWLIPFSRAPGLSFAVGQMVMFRRQAFQAVGGYAAVSDHISEDVFMARAVKRAGFRVTFLDLQDYVRCRMYEGYRAAFTGLSKNIYDFFKNQAAFFASAASALVIFVVLPVVLAVFEALSGAQTLSLSVLSVAVFQLAWALALLDRGQKLWLPFLYPLTFLHLLFMAWKTFGKVSQGLGVVWKDRTLK